MEGAGQVVPRAGDRYMLLLHRLQQRRLGARAGAVDLIGHQQLREDGTGDETKAARAARAFLQHFRAEDVGGHQVRRELDAAGVEAKRGAHGVDQLRFGQPGHADQQRMAAGKNGHQRAVNHVFLSENHGADGVAGRADVGGARFRRPDNHVLEFFGAFFICQSHNIRSSVEMKFSRFCPLTPELTPSSARLAMDWHPDMDRQGCKYVG